MPFFLLGKSSDGELTLLSVTAHATRNDAMAELSQITSEPGFDRWDDEVLVMDLDTGTPVLLMRPAAAVVESPVAEDAEAVDTDEVVAVEEAAAEPEPDALEAAQPEADQPEAVEEQAAGEIEPAPELSEEPSEPESEPTETEDQAAEEPTEAPSGAEAESLPEVEDAEIAAVIDDLIAEEQAEAEPVADAAIADAIIEEALSEPAPADAPSLKDALSRTAAQMESEGIVAPESVGPAEVPVQADEVPDEPAAAAWPWDVAPSDTSSFPPVAQSVPEVETQTPAEQPAPAVAFSLDALEEPAPLGSEESLIRAAGDDETMAVSHPVILDAAPREAPAEPETAEPSPGAAAAGDDISDFILDLDKIVTAEPPAGGEPEPAMESSPLDGLTCGDCVYEETCPNKGQKAPKECGTFQWK